MAVLSSEIAVLRPDLQRMIDQTSALKQEAKVVLEATSPHQWGWWPNPSVWSMDLILDHLNSVGRQGLPAIEGVLAQIRADGRLSDEIPRYSLFERFFIRLLSPNPPFRVPVPPIYAPNTARYPASETGPAFIETLDRLSACIESANGLDLKSHKMPSPASPGLRLTVGAWLEGLVAHNDYHWLQVRALRSHADFPRD